MYEKGPDTQSSSNRQDLLLPDHDESLMTDVGSVDPESVRIQYPQPKELLIRLSGRRALLADATSLDALRKSKP